MICNYEGYDYREIPLEYLDSNIPKGRGMIKWQAFKTMPEQYERIDNMIEEQSKCNPPSFDNDTLMYIEGQVRSKLNKSVVIRYWDNGYEIALECIIEYIDDKSKMVIVNKENELIYIKFKYIYGLM